MKNTKNLTVVKTDSGMEHEENQTKDSLIKKAQKNTTIYGVISIIIYFALNIIALIIMFKELSFKMSMVGLACFIVGIPAMMILAKKDEKILELRSSSKKDSE